MHLLIPGPYVFQIKLVVFYDQHQIEHLLVDRDSKGKIFKINVDASIKRNPKQEKSGSKQK